MSLTPDGPEVLLDTLRIDRASRGGHRRAGPAWMVAVAVLGVGITLVLLGARDGAERDVSTQTAPPRLEQAAGTDALPRPRPPTHPAGPASVLDATGYVVARRQATVSAKTTGMVKELLVEEGMEVPAGYVMARLDDSVQRAEVELALAQVRAARAAIAELEVERAHAGRELERAKTLAARGLLSTAELDGERLAEQISDARHQRALRNVAVAEQYLTVQRRHLADMEIRAPFAGVVVEKAAQPGEMVSPLSAGGGFTRTGLGTIVDMTSLEVEVDVNEAYINRVHPAQDVTVTLNAYPDRQYPARVLAVIPAADRTRATVTVRVGFLEIDRRVLPEMGVRVAFLPIRAKDEEQGS